MSSPIPTDNIHVNSHSSIRIEAQDGTVLYFDPFNITESPHDADYIFFSHLHYDHYSPEDFDKLTQDSTVYVAPTSTKDDLEALGDSEVYTLSPGEHLELDRFSIAAVPAYNVVPERLGYHPEQNQWIGYVVTLDGVSYYIAGDTDHNPDNKKVKCDIALIPIGGTYTMNPQEAAAFINTIRPQVVIPTHYGSIVGSMEDVVAFEQLVDSDISVVKKIQ